MLSTFKNWKLKRLEKYGVLLSLALFVCWCDAFPILLMICNCTPPSDTTQNKSFQHSWEEHRAFMFSSHETSPTAVRSGNSFLSASSSWGQFMLLVHFASLSEICLPMTVKHLEQSFFAFFSGQRTSKLQKCIPSYKQFFIYLLLDW